MLFDSFYLELNVGTTILLRFDGFFISVLSFEDPFFVFFFVVFSLEVGVAVTISLTLGTGGTQSFQPPRYPGD